MTCKHVVIGLCQDLTQTTALLVDTIDELSGFGVTIEGVLFKDGIVDGRDISVDGANLDAHIADMMNPHGTTAAMLGLGPTDTPTFANVISTNGPTIGNHLATKDYVDSVVGGSGVFGTEFNQASKTTLMATTNVFSDGYVTYLSLVTAAVPAGTYRIGWAYDYANDSKRDLLTIITVDATIEARSRLAAVKTIGSNGENAIDGASSNQRNNNSSFLHITFGAAGAHTINIEFTRSDEGTGSGAVSLIDGRIEFWRVS